MAEDAKRVTAYHEAGHTVLAVLHESEIEEVTIVASEDAEGHVKRFSLMKESVQYGDSMKDRDTVEKDIMIFLAGALAERRVVAELDPQTAAWDYHHVHDAVTYMTGSNKESEAYLEWLTIRTNQTLDRLWPHVEAIATLLLERQTLSGPEAVAIFRGVSDRSRQVPNESISSIDGFTNKYISAPEDDTPAGEKQNAVNQFCNAIMTCLLLGIDRDLLETCLEQAIKQNR